MEVKTTYSIPINLTSIDTGDKVSMIKDLHK